MSPRSVTSGKADSPAGGRISTQFNVVQVRQKLPPAAQPAVISSTTASGHNDPSARAGKISLYPVDRDIESARCCR